MILLLAFALSLGICLLLSSQSSPLKVFDEPNGRSLHDVAMPCCGGVGILLSVAMVWLLMFYWGEAPTILANISAAALLVAVVSFVDDRHSLPASLRLAVHALAAVLLINGGLVAFEGWVGGLLTFLAVVWMINLYNFMDGMDGFAGGMTLFGFGFLACAGWLQGGGEYAMYALLVAVSALGFLVVNFPPAKIFMGDVGSVTIGLLAAAFSLWGIQLGLFSWWFPLLVFSPFAIDATVTLLRRILNREHILEAHRSHYYQRLVQLGWGHKKTVLAEYVVMLLAGCSALAAQQINSPVVTAVVLAGWGFIYLIIAVVIHRYESTSVLNSIE